MWFTWNRAHGWFVENGRLSPVMTGMASAPIDVLKYVRRKSKTSAVPICVPVERAGSSV